MKIDDGTLNRYLIKNLQSLTEADPSLLANYVAALLRNNKPKKELQKLCIDQLYDFLGDGTKSFVAKLFHALEDGTVPSSTEEMEPSKPMESGSVVTSTDVVELRTSSPQLERLPSTAVRAFSDEGEDESSDDEDDDRNHKHRRRVTRSRSFDRDGEEEDRGMYRKRGRSTDNGQGLRDSDRLANDRRGPGHAMHSERDNNKFDRRVGREHGSGRFNSEGGQRGNLRTGPQFRGEGPGPRYDGPNGMMRGGMGRGRGLGGSWPPIDQRFPPPPFSDGSEFAPPLLPPGPPTSGFFAGRGIPGRGVPHTPWPGYGPHPGMGNGPLEHPHPLSGGMQGARGPPPMSGGIGLNMSMGRPRCLDFEERGYCLRGDLCPMEHGANRIVVEDVQSLSKFNLPVSIPSGRGMGIGPVSGPSAGPMLPPGLGMVNRGNRGSRETSSPGMGEDPNLLNGAAPASVGAEPDLYDPDQPLWNKERPDASAGLRKLSSYQKSTQDPEWDGDLLEKRENQEGSETLDVVRVGRGGTSNGAQGTESGPSVWDRIGPVDRVGNRLDGGPRPVGSPLEGIPSGKPPRKDGGEEMPARGRGVWPVKWNRDVEVDDESGPRATIANSIPGRGRGVGRSETGSGQRSGEGTSYGSRATGGRGTSGFGSERAQRTLYVSFIPVLSNRTELLTAHFQKFGHVLDIRIPAHSDRAFVQFSRREDAESALTAPDAVMGNRFIRLSWANRDSIPDPGDNTTSPAVKVPGKSGHVTTTQTVKALEKATLNGTANVPAELALSEGAGKAIAANGSSSLPAISGAALKKQEELEKMREVIRRKQESLAQKRVDFRRKLEAKLAKQVPGQGDGSDSEQSAKRQKLDDADENSSGPLKQGVSTTTVSQSSPSQSAPQMTVEHSSSGGLSKSNSGDVPKQSSVTGGVSQPAQPSPRAGRPQNVRGNSTNLTYSQVAWGPARFKLDNRTTIFRVLQPFPSAVTDVAVLKEHFAMFGELSTVEVEDAEGQKVEGISKLSEINSVRVSFATRRAAERAYATGRWLQGQNLQLVWVTSTNNSAGSGGTAGSSSLVTSRVPSGGPSYMEQEGANGNRYSDRESTKSGQEIQDTANDGDVSGEEAGYEVSREEKRASVPNLEWRRENALQVRAATKVVGRSSSGPAISTESGAETRH
ncbi:hypothetical protein Mapa_002542 [Marchantia paleacea]|nr:hypothetical protein Mapa_002542 [Marchantia paleacea]